MAKFNLENRAVRKRRKKTRTDVPKVYGTIKMERGLGEDAAWFRERIDRVKSDIERQMKDAAPNDVRRIVEHWTVDEDEVELRWSITEFMDELFS